MIHPGDEELLDLALGDRDEQVERHVGECAECRTRLDAVRREQEMIRTVLGDVDVPASVRARLAPRRASCGAWMPLAAAAMLLCTTLWFAFSAQSWRSEAERLSSKPAAVPAVEHRFEPEEARWKVKNAAIQMSAARADGTIQADDVGDFKGMMVDLAAGVIELNEDQRRRFDDLMTRILEKLMTGENRRKLVEEYRAGLREFLTAEQFAEMESTAAAEADWMRADAIEMVIDELVAFLDLRHSEGERLRTVLERGYPMPDLLASFAMANPSDALLDDPKLAEEIRRRVGVAYHGKFDQYMAGLRRQRAEIERFLKDGK